MGDWMRTREVRGFQSWKKKYHSPISTNMLQNTRDSSDPDRMVVMVSCVAVDMACVVTPPPAPPPKGGVTWVGW